jgi:hypothetical protein
MERIFREHGVIDPEEEEEEDSIECEEPDEVIHSPSLHKEGN